MTFGMQVLVWDKHNNMAGLNWLMVSQSSPHVSNFISIIQISMGYNSVHFVIRMLLEILSRDRFPSVYTFNLAIAYTAYIYISYPMNQHDCFCKQLIGKREHALIIVVAQIIKTEQSASREITQHTNIRCPSR
jgi:hypothetical protein